MADSWRQRNAMNRVVFDPARHRRHVESFFIKLNDPQHRRAVWLRHTLFSGNAERYAETWGIFFDPASGAPLAAKERWPLSAVRIDPSRDGISIAQCEIDDRRATGCVRRTDFVLSWNLVLVDEQGPYRPFPAAWLYRSRLLSSKLVSPHPCCHATGWIELWQKAAGRSTQQRIRVDGWRAMQGHNWGRGHAERYVWSHTNAFEPPRQASFFEAFAAQVRIGGALTPPVMLGRLVLAGDVYRFDTWKNFVTGHSEHDPTHWRFDVSGPDGRLTGNVEGEPEQTVGLVYANPKGPPAHCLNSKLAHLHLELRPRRGRPLTLESHAAALEVAQLDTDHGIPMVL